MDSKTLKNDTNAVVTPIQKGSICYSFENKTGKLKVLIIYHHHDRKVADCRCIEPHPDGYPKGLIGTWLVRDLRRLDEKFTCTSCNKEWEIEFMYSEGFKACPDESGFDEDEIHYQICGNCDV